MRTKLKLDKEELNGLDQFKLDQKLIEACLIGDLDSVKYLLTSPELDRHADIKGWDEEAFVCACRTGNLDLIDYMLRSPELKEHSNVHVWRDSVFKEACNRKDIALLHYFIFEYKIDKTEEISKYLEKKELTQIAKVFELGDARKLTLKDFPKDEVKSKQPRYKYE